MTSSRHGLLLMATILGVGCKVSTPAKAAKEETYRVARHDLRDVLTQVGTVRPVRTVEIKSEATGRIDKIAVIEGQRVRAGDTLLTIDPQLALIQKKRLQLSLESARLELAKAQREYESGATLDRSALLPRLELDERRDAVRRMSIREREVLLQIEEIEEQLRKTVIRAPLTGIITNLYVAEGEIAASVTAGVQGGTSVARMIDAENLEVVVQVSEVDYVRLRSGQTVTLRPEAFPTVQTSGKISFLAMNAKKTAEKELGAFEVRIAIEAVVPGILPGSNVSVDFLMLDKARVLAVPCHFVSEEKRAFFVDVLSSDQGGRTVRSHRQVELGATDFKYYEVLSGVTEGDVIGAPAGL
jgi:HlyD family secretion protein